MDHLDKEVIESLSEPAKRVFKSLDYRSKQCAIWFYDSNFYRFQKVSGHIG